MESDLPQDGQGDSLGQEQSLSKEQALSELAEGSNTQLQESGAEATQHGFNLGCSMSLIPGAILLALVLLISRGNIAALGIALVLTIMIALGLASLLAYVAGRRAQERAYSLHVQPDIARRLKDLPASWEDFEHAAQRTLPAKADLLRLLQAPPADENEQKKETSGKQP